MAELHVQIDQNTIEYEIFASDGDCSQPKTYKAKISPSSIGSFGEIKAKDYTLYTQGIIGYYETNKSTIVDKFGLTSEEDLLIELIIQISKVKIELIDDNHKVYLTYTKNDCDRKRDIDVYFNKQDKEPYDIPILFKHGDRFFAPKDKNSYFTRWNEIKELENFSESNDIQLNDYINGVYNKLTEADISQTNDYGIPCKGSRIFESDDKKFNTKRFSVSKNDNQGKRYKTVTHKHCSVDSVQHKPRIGNICSFNGCKFDNEHITVVKNDTIDEVVVFFHKDDSTCKYPKLVLLNKYSKTYGSTTYGYYNLNETPDPCKGYEFKHFQRGCQFNLILADDDPVYCEDVIELRHLISEILKEPTLRTPDRDDCKCSGTAVDVQTPDHGTDGSNGEVVEEKEVIDEGTASEFSKKPVSLSQKITLKRGANPPNTYQPIDRATKKLSYYSRFIYTAKTVTTRSVTGSWNLYADTFFGLGTKENCVSSRQPGSSRCELIKFKVSEHIIERFYEKEFYSIDVFFHTKNNLSLLIQFFNGTIQHIIRTSMDDDNGWKKLDKPLNFKNDSQLLKWLKEIESNIDTFFLLIDNVISYKTSDVQDTIKKTNQILYVSPYQSLSISVKPEDLFKQNYKKCEHKIHMSHGSASRPSYTLKLFMSNGSEVVLYNSNSSKRKEKLEYNHGQGQNTMDVYLFKSSSVWIPVLISYNGKVYQQKTDYTKTAKTNKWVHIPKDSNLISSVGNQENNLMLRKKLCLLKKEVETNKHHSASETLKQSPGQVSQVRTDSTSQHGRELQSTQDSSRSPNKQGPQSLTENQEQLHDVQSQPATIDGTPSQPEPSHPASPQTPVKSPPEQGYTSLVASGQETPGAETPNGGMGNTGADVTGDSVSQGTGLTPGTPEQPSIDVKGPESGQEPAGNAAENRTPGSSSSGSGSSIDSVSSGNDIGQRIKKAFENAIEYAQNNPAIVGGGGGAVAGVGVMATVGGVVYKKCIVGSAVAAGKAAAKVAAAAASGMYLFDSR